MTSSKLLAGRETTERVRYFARQLMTADDMRAEQEYFLEKLRRHNRFLHGWGVVCGLEVAPAPEEGRGTRVRVGCGYALGPQGDEIHVGRPAFLDLATCGARPDPEDPCAPETPSPRAATPDSHPDVLVAIRYVECSTRPVRVMPAGCGCDESACEFSRTRDAFELRCWPVPADWKPPVRSDASCDDIIKAMLTCPPCPSDPWVVLARVAFGGSQPSSIKSIDNFVRRWIMSTTALQGVCCGHASEHTTPDETPVDVRISLKPTQLRLEVGRSATIRATVQAEGGGATTVTWSSANGAIASVGQDGKVTGVSRGSTSVRATSTANPAVFATATVTVK